MRHSIKSETSIFIGFAASLKENSIAKSRSNFQFLKTNQVRIFYLTFDTAAVSTLLQVFQHNLHVSNWYFSTRLVQEKGEAK